MDDEQHASKRPRLEGGSSPRKLLTLTQLLHESRWDEAIERCRQNPREVATLPDPSPLAIACRSGAPYECVRAVLKAAPIRLRNVLDSRGTPLHEAIVCENTEVKVIDALLKADEALGNDTTRATLLQDVDGFTPLHLLIRRRFQSHILSSDEDMSLMEILEMLVSSCPEAVVIPDRGEYEEPPIVYALKANIYAPSINTEDATLSRVERQIYEMVRTMLRHAPSAAAQVFNGFRGQYSALHSAVFHGRYTSTIDLLLKTEAEFPGTQKTALLANTQSELPLHFCAMRGERPRTVALLAHHAPEAVLKRDASGLTPFHWLWIRFVSTLLAMDEDRRGEETTFNLNTNVRVPYETNRYNEFTTIEQDDFDRDLPLIKRLDPPVDFLRMRHIPLEVTDNSECLEWANRSRDVLTRIRERHSGSTDSEEHPWTRQEAVVGLFWTKVVSLLGASCLPESDMPLGDSVLVHAAFASPCCLPPVAHLAASLFPEELMQRDARGRLPIHYAACRSWHAWDWPREDGVSEPAAARLLHGESLAVLQVAMNISPSSVVRVADGDNRLVLHHVIDTFVKACSRPASSTRDGPVQEMLDFLRQLVRSYPESLQRRDGVSKLYPFLQATAVATAQQQTQTYVHDELPLSITYELLREDPSILAG